MSKGRILLIEDEESLNSIIALNLQLEGFDVDSVTNGKEAIALAPDVEDYNLVILDVMLPEVSGWDICEAYKKVAETPILFMSAKGASVDKVKGLKLGADDYLGKPFDLEELLLRVQLLVSRSKKEMGDDPEFKIGDCHINRLTYEVKQADGNVVELTKRELELLQLFVEHEGEVVSRDFILEQLWKQEVFPTARTIDNYILNYRKLFEKDPKNPVFFHSVRGVGYKFVN